MTAILERRQARLRLRRAARQSVSAGLEAWLGFDDPPSLGTLSDAFGDKILAAGCLAFMAPSALPIPTGGATHVFDVIALLFAVQMVLARRIAWLPERWRRRELGPKAHKAMRFLVRFVKFCERFSRPRLPSLMRSRVGEVVLGVVVLVFVVGAFLSPPFSGLDTLPSLGVVLIALGILFEDALFAIAGFVAGVGGIGLAIGFGVQATHVVSHLLH